MNEAGLECGRKLLTRDMQAVQENKADTKRVYGFTSLVAKRSKTHLFLSHMLLFIISSFTKN